MFLGERAFDDQGIATINQMDAVITLLVDATCGAQTADASEWVINYDS